jgi:hypothetical protein
MLKKRTHPREKRVMAVTKSTGSKFTRDLPSLTE